MTIALIGIISVQIVWINGALELKHTQFRNSVIEAMEKGSEKIETRAYLSVFEKENDIDFEMPPPPPPPPPSKGIKITIPDFRKKNNKINLSIKSSGSHGNQSLSITTDMDSVLKNFENQFKFTISTDSLFNFERKMDDSIYFAINKIVGKTSKLKWMSDKILYEVMSKKSFGELSADSVKSILTKEFEANGIGLPFAVFLTDSGKITSATEEITDTLKTINKAYQASLFPNEILPNPLYMGVIFKGETEHLLKSLNWLLAASILFTLLIISAFSLSIFSILHQKRVTKVKSDFINNMTHEFKTPIATIGVAADSLVNAKVIGDKEKVEHYARIIKQENKRMNGHVEKILEVARMERKEVDFRIEPVDLHQLCAEACEIFRLKIEESRGSLKCSFEALNPVVAGDREHLMNSVLNLLDNALKYNNQNPEILLNAENYREGVILSVTDNGIGMSKQIQNRIFDTFYRKPTGNMHNVKGFGLGLSYVKAVITAHKGCIKVESEPGKGSTFSLYLPFQNYKS